MKRQTVNKLLAIAVSAALCVPILLTDATGANSAVAFASGEVTPNPSVSGGDGNQGGGTQTPGGDDNQGGGTQTPGGDDTQTPGDDNNQGGNDNSVSDNGSSSSEESSSSNDTTSAPAVVTSRAGASVVVGSSRVTSTVGGIFTATSVTGTAITTPMANLASAIGLSSAELQAGTNVRSYICDNRDQASRASLQNAAAAAGKTVAGFVNMDLYTITKRGVVTKVTTASEPVTVAFGIPGRFVNANRNFSILVIDPTGKTVVMDDIDTDPRSITINTKVFGAFSIVY